MHLVSIDVIHPSGKYWIRHCHCNAIDHSSIGLKKLTIQLAFNDSVFWHNCCVRSCQKCVQERQINVTIWQGNNVPIIHQQQRIKLISQVNLILCYQIYFWRLFDGNLFPIQFFWYITSELWKNVQESKPKFNLIQKIKCLFSTL